MSDGSFDFSDLHRLNRVPINDGRPMPASIGYVRLTAFRSVGGPDSDGGTLSDGGFLGISELQVYEGTPPTPTPTATPLPTVSPTPTPPPPAPGRLKASLARTAGRLGVSRKGAVTVKVGCVRASAGTLPPGCRVLLTLAGRLPGDRRASTLARRTVTVAAGRTVSVRLTLSRAALKALRRHTLNARLTARVGSATAVKAVRLRAALENEKGRPPRPPFSLVPSRNTRACDGGRRCAGWTGRGGDGPLPGEALRCSDLWKRKGRLSGSPSPGSGNRNPGKLWRTACG